MFQATAFSHKRLVLTTLFLLAAPVVLADCVTPQWEETTIGSGMDFVAAADFNEDGRPDIAAANATSVAVLLNNGSGGFHAPVTLHSGTVRTNVRAADMNGDDNIDILFAGTSDLVVLPGNGDGTFGAAVLSPLTLAPRHLALALPNVYALDPLVRQFARFFPAGGGTLAEVSRGTMSDGFASSLAGGDLDLDGFVDVVLGLVGPAGGSNVRVFYGNGTGAFDAPVPVPFSHETNRVRLGDADGDGLLDLFVTTDPSIAIFRNLGGRNFGDPVAYAGTANARMLAIELGELTGDGDLDAVTFDTGLRLISWTGSGLGTFEHSRSLGQGAGPSSAADIAAADFDADGRTDLVIAFNADIGRLKLLRNRCGDAALMVTVKTPVINPDGTSDIEVTVAGQPYSGIPATGTVTLLENGDVVTTASVVNGVAVLTASGLAVGTHTFTISYSGDAQFEPFESVDAATVRVTTDTTTTVITLDRYEGTVAERPNVTVNVTSSTGSTPTGKIEIPGTACASPCQAPTATAFTFSDLPGTYTVTARFLGDADHPPSTATPVTYELRKVSPTLGVTPTSGRARSPVPVQVTLTTAYQGLHLGGYVNLLENGILLDSQAFFFGSRTLTLTIPPRPAGQHVFEFVYSGDSRHEVAELLVPFHLVLTFTDDPLTAGTLIRSIHLQEIVTATNDRRATLGLTPIPTGGYGVGAVVTAAQINGLRTAINEVRAAEGAAPYPFTNAITPGTVIRREDVQELRAALR